MPNTLIGGELTNDRVRHYSSPDPSLRCLRGGERFYKFDTTKHQTAERDIEYQDIGHQSVSKNIFLNLRSDYTIITILNKQEFEERRIIIIKLLKRKINNLKLKSANFTKYCFC